MCTARTITIIALCVVLLLVIVLGAWMLIHIFVERYSRRDRLGVSIILVIHLYIAVTGLLEALTFQTSCG